MSTKSKYGEITLRNEFLPIREPQRNFVNIGKFRRNEIPLKAAKAGDVARIAYAHDEPWARPEPGAKEVFDWEVIAT